MGQTSRFLEKIYDERDYMSELQSKIETTVAALCDGDIEKSENILSAIWGLQNQANSLSRQVWLDIEPEIKKENLMLEFEFQSKVSLLKKYKKVRLQKELKLFVNVLQKLNFFH